MQQSQVAEEGESRWETGGLGFPWQSPAGSASAPGLERRWPAGPSQCRAMLAAAHCDRAERGGEGGAGAGAGGRLQGAGSGRLPLPGERERGLKEGSQGARGRCWCVCSRFLTRPRLLGEKGAGSTGHLQAESLVGAGEGLRSRLRGGRGHGRQSRPGLTAAAAAGLCWVLPGFLPQAWFWGRAETPVPAAGPRLQRGKGGTARSSPRACRP